jgi:NAD+ diphosphatase
MELQKVERAKRCPQCGLLHFPRLAPAIIVLIERGDRLLLARARRFPTAMYSVLAGFVEPGESLEEAVAREVKEEVGLSLRDIRYFGSQPWPFPDSLMIGFTAEYADGVVMVDNNEILDARWFGAEDMPEIPGKVSISRALIDHFLARARKKE